MPDITTMFDDYWRAMEAYKQEVTKRQDRGLEYNLVRNAHQFALTFVQCKYGTGGSRH